MQRSTKASTHSEDVPLNPTAFVAIESVGVGCRSWNCVNAVLNGKNTLTHTPRLHSIWRIAAKEESCECVRVRLVREPIRDNVPVRRDFNCRKMHFWMSEKHFVYCLSFGCHCLSTQSDVFFSFCLCECVSWRTLVALSSAQSIKRGKIRRRR